MSDDREFQKILDQVLAKEQTHRSPRAGSTDFRGALPVHPGAGVASLLGVDFPIFKTSVGKAYTTLKFKPLKTEARAEEMPPPRIKRNLTRDQELALKVFARSGEILDAYSTIEEIKSAYRKLAKKFHPDAGGSEEKFKLIASAYKKLA